MLSQSGHCKILKCTHVVAHFGWKNCGWEIPKFEPSLNMFSSNHLESVPGVGYGVHCQPLPSVASIHGRCIPSGKLT